MIVMFENWYFSFEPKNTFKKLHTFKKRFYVLLKNSRLWIFNFIVL